VRADRPPPGIPAGGGKDERVVLVVPTEAFKSTLVMVVHDRSGSCGMRSLYLLGNDQSLEPRNIIVMCPDIETFAPLIHAMVGAGVDAMTSDPSDSATEMRPADLRVRLADRSLRQTNPVLAVVSELLSLAEARLTASQVRLGGLKLAR
jgi:exodeoxyribonuclease V gamma subunit